MIKILLSIVSIGLVTCSNERNANAQTNSQARKVEWNTLKARWGPDPLTTDGESFVRQPRTVQQAQQERYEKLPTASGDSCVGKTTVGHRYWKQQDSGAILIYDKQGTISGIQLAVSRTRSAFAHLSSCLRSFLNQQSTINIIRSIGKRCSIERKSTELTCTR